MYTLVVNGYELTFNNFVSMLPKVIEYRDIAFTNSRDWELMCDYLESLLEMHMIKFKQNPNTVNWGELEKYMLAYQNVKINCRGRE